MGEGRGSDITRYHKLKLRVGPYTRVYDTSERVLEMRMTAGGMRQCGTDTVQKIIGHDNGNNYKQFMVRPNIIF